MARAAARIADLEAGRLPRVCAKTGEAADGSTKLEFTSSPTWTLILLLFGILPFLIAQHFARVRVVGIVPMSDDALGRVRIFNRTVVGLIVLSVLVLIAGLFATDGTVILIGLALLLAVILLMAVGSPFVLPTGQGNGGVGAALVRAPAIRRCVGPLVRRFLTPHPVPALRPTSLGRVPATVGGGRSSEERSHDGRGRGSVE